MSTWTKFRDKLVAKIFKLFGVEKVDDAFEGVSASAPSEPSSAASDADSSSDPATNRDEELGASPSSHEVANSVAGSFSWRFGGFDGGKASEDTRCRVSRLAVRASGLSLRWDTGIPANWKRSGEGFIIAAVFYWDGKGWVGGKFDWIDTARSTRDFKNIDSGYNGWNGKAFHSATRYAFCVVSADGKHRSPFVECGK